MKFDTVFNSTGDTFDTEFQTGYGGGVTVDEELSETSTNPVQNKVVTAELNTKAAAGGYAPEAVMGTSDSGDLKAYAKGNAITIEDGQLSVETTDDIEGGSLPMSAAGVNVIVGNIDVLLKTI